MIKSKMPKNKVTTQGYFIRSLRNAGYNTSRVYDRYSPEDIRKWTIVINANTDSIFITCVDKGEWPWRGLFHIDDASNIFPQGLYINTDSTDVILKHLDEFKVKKLDDKLNNNNERARGTTERKEK